MLFHTNEGISLGGVLFTGRGESVFLPKPFCLLVGVHGSEPYTSESHAFQSAQTFGNDLASRADSLPCFGNHKKPDKGSVAVGITGDQIHHSHKQIFVVKSEKVFVLRTFPVRQGA